jgi:hypothetical protein
MQRGQFVGLFRKEQDAERYAEDAFKVEPT